MIMMRELEIMFQLGPLEVIPDPLTTQIKHDAPVDISTHKHISFTND